MSQPSPLNKFAVYEPRMELNNERSFVIVKGGQTITYYPYPATSYSNANFNFTTNPPGKQNVLDRVVIIDVPVTLTFVGGGDSSGDRILQRGRDAFRSYPISSITSTLTSKINGFPVSIELSEVVHLLSRYHTPLEDKNTFASLSLQMEDNYQNYSDADGANNNPLGVYQDNSTQVPRGAYPMIVSVNTNTNATVNAIIREYIILPPYIFDGHEAGGLTNLDTLEFNWVLNPNLQRIWSRSTANTVPLTSLTCNFGQPTMYLAWITPRLTQTIPSLMVYPYFQISKYVANQPNGVVNSNTSQILMSQVIQFNSIPRKIYIFAKQSNSIIYSSLANMINTTDTFLPITKLNINWDNKVGVLSSAVIDNLYSISVCNGLKVPFVEFNGLTYNIGTVATDSPSTIGLAGAPICLELGKDVGLQDNQAEGLVDKINFQVQASVFNVNQSQNLTPDLYVVAIYDGILEIFDNSARAYIGVISQEEILNASVNHGVTYKQLEMVYGGDFFSKFKEVAGDIYRGLKDSKILSNVLGQLPHPIAQKGAEFARNLGLGEGGARAGDYEDGGVLIGGRAMKKSDYTKMKRKLKQMSNY